MRTCFLSTILWASLFLSVFAQGNKQPFSSPVERAAFGSHLLCAGDYARALDELSPVIALQPSDTLAMRTAYCYFMTGQMDAMFGLLDTIKHPVVKAELFTRVLRTQFEQNAYADAEQFLKKTQFADSLVYPLWLVTRALQEKPFAFQQTALTTLSGEMKVKFSELLLATQQPPAKSPLKAALLSAIVPGLGKIYTGKTGDGITAFLTTGLMAFLAVDNYRHGHDFRCAVFSVSGVLFYAGAIYGSAASAQIENELQASEAKDRLSDFTRMHGCFLQAGNALCGGAR